VKPHHLLGTQYIPTYSQAENVNVVNVSPASTDARDYETLNLEIADAQAETLQYKSKIVVNKRRRDEDMRRMLEEQETDQRRVRDERKAVQKGYDEIIRLMRESQVCREAEIRREIESVVAAARVSSAPSTAAPSVTGETGTCGPSGAGDTLTDRALMMRRGKTAREHAANPVVVALSLASNKSNAVSSIDKVTSERPDSLNFSSSFSRSANEVEGRLFKECGKGAARMSQSATATPTPWTMRIGNTSEDSGPDKIQRQRCWTLICKAKR
jgi:hypothetical protein